jgi:hypothetical protein
MQFAVVTPEATQFPLVVKVVVVVLCIIGVILIAAYDKTVQLLGSAIKRITGIFH